MHVDQLLPRAPTHSAAAYEHLGCSIAHGVEKRLMADVRVLEAETAPLVADQTRYLARKQADLEAVDGRLIAYCSRHPLVHQLVERGLSPSVESRRGVSRRLNRQLRQHLAVHLRLRRLREKVQHRREPHPRMTQVALHQLVEARESLARFLETDGENPLHDPRFLRRIFEAEGECP